MFKPSRRAAVIAASFALGLSAVRPAAHAGLLGGSDSDSTAIDGIGLPAGDLLGGDLLGGLLGGGLLGGDLLGGVLGGGLPVVGPLLGGDLLAGVLGGDVGGDLVADVLGGDVLGGVLGGDLLGGGLPVVGALGDGGLPLVGDVLGEEGLLGGELLNVATDTTLHCDAAIPQVLRTFLGEVTDAVCEPFSYGLLGLLGSL